MRVEYKTCNKCGNTHNIDQFARNKNCTGGRLTTCKLCYKEYRQQHAEARRLTDANRRLRNGISPKRIFTNDDDRKTAHIQACIKWQRANHQRYAQQQKAYRDANKVRRYALIHLWRQENQGQMVAWAAKRRAATAQATPTWVCYKTIASIYEHSQELSRVTGIPHQVDHYYPIHGNTVCGLHVAENLQIITKQENLDKGKTHPDIFYARVP